MPLQREFRGMADYVGQYTGGKLPIELPATLQAVFEADDFVNPVKFATWQTVVAAQGTFSVTDVPDGEVWRVRWIGLNYSNPAAVTSVFAPVVRHENLQYYGLQYNPGSISSTAGNQAHQTGLLLGYPGFWLEPRMQIGFVTALYSGAAAITTNGICCYQRIEI